MFLIRSKCSALYAMYVSDEYSELGQELKNGFVIDPSGCFLKFQNLAPMHWATIL